MAGLHGQDGFLNSVKTLASIDACTSKHSDMVIQPNLQSGLLFLHHSGHSRHTHRNTPNGLMVMPIYTFISAISSSVKNKCSFPRPVSEEIRILKELKQMSRPKENLNILTLTMPRCYY